MEQVRQLIPPVARIWIYAVYAITGLIIGAIQASGATYDWVEPALNVLAYLAVPIAIIAGVNVPADTDDYVGRYKLED